MSIIFISTTFFLRPGTTADCRQLREEFEREIEIFLTNCNTEIATVDSTLANLGRDICHIMSGISKTEVRVKYPRDLDIYLTAYLSHLHRLVGDEGKDMRKIQRPFNKLKKAVGLFERTCMDLENVYDAPYSSMLQGLTLKNPTRKD